MKRLIIRTTALAGILAIGWIAIAQTQRNDDSFASSTQTDDTVKESNPLRPDSSDSGAYRLPAPSSANAKYNLQKAPASALVPLTDVDPQLSDPFGVRPVTGLLPADRNVSQTPRPLPSNSTAMAPLNATGGDRYATDGRYTANNGLGQIPDNPANTIPANTIPANNMPANDIPSPFAQEANSRQIAEGTGTPAKDRRLEGTQAPQLTIEKFAPAEIQVGNPALFRIVVQNTSQVIARGVEIRDQVPRGTRLIETTPRASRDVGGELIWKLGDMKPGEEKTAVAKLMPLSEGEIGSVATVHFEAGASVRTTAVKPQLVVKSYAPKAVMIGEDVKLTINVSNPGSGVARGVVITEQVPAGLQHRAGSELEYELGDLKPLESRDLELILHAARPGKMINTLVARADAGLQSKDELPLEVMAPHLKLAISGPKQRFLQRKTTYKLSVSNPGTAPARNVCLQAKLPDGMSFVEANNNGHYDPQTKTVAWALAELPVNETGTVLLTAMPQEIGEQKLTYRGEAEGAVAVEEQKEILVDGIAAMRFEVLDVNDPVEKGNKALYEIRVINQGTKAGNNVRIQVALPMGMKFVEAEGPAGLRPVVSGNQIAFEPLRRLSPKVDVTYRLRVECIAAGDQRISVRLQTDEMQSPVTKEESTRVFSDN